MKLSNDKLILVIGGTGAQGQAVVKALVEPSSDGAPSPYTVRILTRNPDHPKVKAELNHPNVELVQGSFTDLAKVERALKGVWGAYINTDGFTVGEQSGDLLWPPHLRACCLCSHIEALCLVEFGLRPQERRLPSRIPLRALRWQG